MRCLTAKQNPVLMRLAIRHYLDNDKNKGINQNETTQTQL